jgi:hypothetical protein
MDLDPAVGTMINNSRFRSGRAGELDQRATPYTHTPYSDQATPKPTRDTDDHRGQSPFTVHILLQPRVHGKNGGGCNRVYSDVFFLSFLRGAADSARAA